MLEEGFDLNEMARLLHVKRERIVDWTNGRPVTIEPSGSPAKRRGMPRLYTLEDTYLMGVALELGKLGLASLAIAKFVEATKKEFPRGIGHLDWLTAWRKPKKASKPGEPKRGRPSVELSELAEFVLRPGKVLPAKGRSTYVRVHVGRVVARVDKRAASKADFTAHS